MESGVLVSECIKEMLSLQYFFKRIATLVLNFISKPNVHSYLKAHPFIISITVLFSAMIDNSLSSSITSKFVTQNDNGMVCNDCCNEFN